MKRYLLDTGIIVGLVRNAHWATAAYSELDLAESQVFISVICKGELLALTEKRKWESRKRHFLERILDGIPSADISNSEVLSAYARIDAWTHGNQLADPEIPPPPKPARPMAQNDLWTAATAHASKATLVSTDSDFLHLKDIWFQLAFVKQDR